MSASNIGAIFVFFSGYEREVYFRSSDKRAMETAVSNLQQQLKEAGLPVRTTKGCRRLLRRWSVDHIMKRESARFQKQVTKIALARLHRRGFDNTVENLKWLETFHGDLDLTINKLALLQAERRYASALACLQKSGFANTTENLKWLETFHGDVVSTICKLSWVQEDRQLKQQLHALKEERAPVQVVIDGHNVLKGDASPPRKIWLCEHVQAYYDNTRAEVVLAFDGYGQDMFSENVRVCFGKWKSADDIIADDIEYCPTKMHVIVTSDKELRARVTAKCALPEFISADTFFESLLPPLQ